MSKINIRIPSPFWCAIYDYYLGFQVLLKSSDFSIQIVPREDKTTKENECPYLALNYDESYNDHMFI